MSKLMTLPDESGIVWHLSPDKQPSGDPTDPVRPLVDKVLQQGHILGDLVLPDELPRFLQCHPPQWSRVVAVWQSEGDTPAFRRELAIQTTRQALYGVITGEGS